MYDLTDINTLHRIFEKNGFNLKKGLGQNFIVDPEVCPQIAHHADIDGEGVIEIGPGAGVLTCELAKRAKKVVCIELDTKLKPILADTLSDFDNVTVVFADVMKCDLKAIINEHFKGMKVSVCANLPYYITSPIIMMLLESRLPIDNITVMVQLEAAERICAEVGTRESGAVTAAVSYYAEKEILFEVSRKSFMPSPNVDSAVIKLSILKEPPISVDDEKKFFRLVKACFAQRRKTLVNTVSNTLNIEKNKLREALKMLELPETVRGEQLNLEQLGKLSDLI